MNHNNNNNPQTEQLKEPQIQDQQHKAKKQIFCNEK